MSILNFNPQNINNFRFTRKKHITCELKIANVQYSIIHRKLTGRVFIWDVMVFCIHIFNQIWVR